MCLKRSTHHSPTLISSLVRMWQWGYMELQESLGCHKTHLKFSVFCIKNKDTKKWLKWPILCYVYFTTLRKVLSFFIFLKRRKDENLGTIIRLFYNHQCRKSMAFLWEKTIRYYLVTVQKLFKKHRISVTFFADLSRLISIQYFKTFWETKFFYLPSSQIVKLSGLPPPRPLSLNAHCRHIQGRRCDLGQMTPPNLLQFFNLSGALWAPHHRPVGTTARKWS